MNPSHPAPLPDPDTVLRAGRQFSACLLLNRRPVGVRLLRSAADYAASPAPERRGVMPYCVGVKLAADGYSLKADRAHSKCGGGRRALGLEDPSETFQSGAEYHSFGLYRDLDTARVFAGEMRFLPGGSVYGYELAPLTFFSENRILPDVVIAVLNAAQGMRAMQGYAFHRGHHDRIRSSGNQATCSEATAIPYLTDDLNLSLGCSGTRYLAGWKPEEMLLGMSLRTFLDVSDGVYRTLNGAVPADQKAVIAQKLTAAGIPVDHVEARGAYFYKEKPE